MAHHSVPYRFPIFHVKLTVETKHFEKFCAELVSFDSSISIMLIAQECEQTKGIPVAFVMLMSLIVISHKVVEFLGRMEASNYIRDISKIDSESLFEILCDISESM